MKKLYSFLSALFLAVLCAGAENPAAPSSTLTPGISNGTAASTAAAALLEPDGTYIYAEKDGQELYLDIYESAKGSAKVFDSGKEKPSILFIFGGGFKGGQRDHKVYNPWFKAMCENGYRVISIDYRLGMRGKQVKGLINQSNAINEALEMAVEDLFSATCFINDNAAELGIDPLNIVLCGSSAGAMTALRAEYEISNDGASASVLPQGFNYAGVMSFSGAVLSLNGAISYKKEPAPTFLAHGTADKLVTYRKIQLFKRNMSGSDALAKIYAKKGCNYRIYRFEGNGHEICNTMLNCLAYELDFLEWNVSGGQKRVIDANVNDPSIPKGKSTSPRQMYGN